MPAVRADSSSHVHCVLLSSSVINDNQMFLSTAIRAGEETPFPPQPSACQRLRPTLITWLGKTQWMWSIQGNALKIKSRKQSRSISPLKIHRSCLPLKENRTYPLASSIPDFHQFLTEASVQWTFSLFRFPPLPQLVPAYVTDHPFVFDVQEWMFQTSFFPDYWNLWTSKFGMNENAH